MKIKTVSTVLATNTAGQVVESRPVREVIGPVQNSAGQLVSPVFVEEDPLGIPARFVAGTTALNSIGQVVDATPVTGVGVPSGYSRTTYQGVPVTDNGVAVFDNGFNFYYLKAA